MNTNTNGKFYLLLTDLRRQYGARIPYKELLRTYHWKKKRDTIVQRDDNKCQTCGAMGTQPIEKDGKVSYESSEVEILITPDGHKIPRQRKNSHLKPTVLNVHHVHYKYKAQPWDYPDEDLITLCVTCHMKEHGFGDTQVVHKKFEYINNVKECEKCSGQGFIEFYSYNWFGLCFNCAGNGCVIEYK